MLNPKDLYTYYEIKQIADDTTNTAFGTIYIKYEITRYQDLRNLGTTSSHHIACTQRIVIPNGSPYTPGGNNPHIFSGYPAIVTSQVTIGGDSQIVSYSPRTLNSSITTSHSDSSGNTKTATHQHTSGSSTSQSNTYGASVTVGFSGWDPMASATLSHDWTKGSDANKSVLNGSEVGGNSQLTTDDSMSVKDWACYSYLGADPSVTWVWAQEYPWNVIQYRGDAGILPGFVSALLYDGNQLLPPSQLSQFGIDFTMKSGWIVPADDSTTVIEHSLDYYTATHQVISNAVSAQINKKKQTFTYQSPGLDLCRYALDPLLNTDSAPSAIIGFVPRQFLVPPVPATADPSDPVPFKIISTGNNLLITDTTDYANDHLTSADAGAGFAASETALTAAFTDNCTSLTMSVNFKLLDTDTAYKLFMKHWKSSDTGVRMTIVVNGDQDSQIVLYIDALEAEGGESNLSSIALRDLSFGSTDYHDYLQLGLNQLDITLTPLSSGNPSKCGYHIRALSIEEA
jgi:hypothetical protein